VEGGLPAPLGASITTSDAIPLNTSIAMMQAAAKRAAEDDELAIIAILLGMQ